MVVAPTDQFCDEWVPGLSARIPAQAAECSLPSVQTYKANLEDEMGSFGVTQLMSRAAFSARLASCSVHGDQMGVRSFSALSDQLRNAADLWSPLTCSSLGKCKLSPQFPAGNDTSRVFLLHFDGTCFAFPCGVPVSPVS